MAASERCQFTVPARLGWTPVARRSGSSPSAGAPRLLVDTQRPEKRTGNCTSPFAYASPRREGSDSYEDRGRHVARTDHDTAVPEQDDAVSPLRVIIADDDPLARRMLRDMLQQANITVIAEAEGGREAVELAVYYRPDIVVMDLIMPGIDGLTATKCIVERAPEVRVVMLSSSDDSEVGVESVRAGAVGFLSKGMGIDALPRALRSAHAGEAVVSRRLTMRMIEILRLMRHDNAGLRPIRSPLTPREWEVLDLLCQERSTDEIADTLVVSVETVRSHVKNVLRKLGVRSRRDAIGAAARLRAEMLGVPQLEH